MFTHILPYTYTCLEKTPLVVGKTAPLVVGKTPLVVGTYRQICMSTSRSSICSILELNKCTYTCGVPYAFTAQNYDQHRWYNPMSAVSHMVKQYFKQSAERALDLQCARSMSTCEAFESCESFPCAPAVGSWKLSQPNY